MYNLPLTPCSAPPSQSNTPPHTAQDHTVVLPWDLSDVTVAGALEPYRRKYRHIHVRAPVARLLRRFEDSGLQAEFDAVSGQGQAGPLRNRTVGKGGQGLGLQKVGEHRSLQR